MSEKEQISKFGYINKNNIINSSSNSIETQGKHFELSNMNGIHSDMLMDIQVYCMIGGEILDFSFPDKEFILLLIEGDIQLIYDDKTEHCIRKSFIEEEPYVIHSSKGSLVQIISNSKTELLLQATTNDRVFETKLYKPEDCILMISGEGRYDGRATRIVRTVIDYSIAPYSNLVIGEVVSESGGWSSYIPHHHPQPEVYYYRYEREEGFGACFIGDDVYKVSNRSYATIEGGLTHPQVTAPGYPMYYAWMIRHLDENPWTSRIDDERYTWLTEN